MLGILVLFSLSFISAVQINNVTISSTGGDSVYANYSDITQLTVTNSFIKISKAKNESLFYALSNFTLQISGLVSPYNNIYFDYANNIIKTQNEDVSLSLGDRLLIYALGSIGNGGGTTIINNGGGTSYIQINLYDLKLKNSAWYKNQENYLYAYTYDLDGNPIDVDSISFSNNPYEKQRLGVGVYRVIYQVLNDSNINITVTATDKSKTIKKSKEIKIFTPTIFNKMTGAVIDFSNRTIDLISFSWFWILILFIFGVFISVVIVLEILRKKRKV